MTQTTFLNPEFHYFTIFEAKINHDIVDLILEVILGTFWFSDAIIVLPEDRRATPFKTQKQS